MTANTSSGVHVVACAARPAPSVAGVMIIVLLSKILPPDDGGRGGGDIVRM